MAMVFLENVSKVLLFLHLVAAGALVGSMTHQVLLVIQFCRGRFEKKKLESLYIQIAFWCYLAVFGLGGLIYPTFRVQVRAEFDTDLPWATGLFEVKENLTALGLMMVTACFFLRRRFDPERQQEKLVFYAPLSFLLYLTIWYAVAVGYYLVTLKAV